MPQISVIIPVHNTALYLRRCVDSIRNQTLRDIEIVLVENLSTDNSASICDEYSLIDSRIKTLHLSVAGPSVARNAGIEKASSPFIGFIDSDDYIEATMYEDLLNAIVSYQADMAYCNFCYKYEDGSEKHLYSNSRQVCSFSSKKMVLDILLEKVSSSPCTKLFKKELFDILKFPEGIFYEDHSTVYKWAAMCSKVVWIDNTYYYYLQRSGSTCHSTDLKKQYDYFLAEFERLDYVNSNSIFNDQEQKLLTATIVKNCLTIFKIFMLKPNHTQYKSEIRGMRRRLYECLSLQKGKINPKDHTRLKKIVYFWPIYYLTHFYSKKK